MPAPAAFPDWPAGMSLPFAARYVGLSESAFLAADTPAPVWLTERRKVWRRCDLDRWLAVKAGDVTLRELGVPPDVIAAITSHRTEQMVRKYSEKRRKASQAVQAMNERKKL